MKIMYMDESGKNIISQPKQNIFIFGGVIVDQSRIYEALNEFKDIYQNSRIKLKEMVKKEFLKEGISEQEISRRMTKMFDKFEFHAVKMINRKDKYRGKKLIEENVWKYCPPTEVFKIINEIFIKISPYINSLYMFKVEKQSYIDYCNGLSITPSDSLCYEHMIEFVLSEYNSLLMSEKIKGAIVPDRLESRIRDNFVQAIHVQKYNTFWTEPIPVDSDTNAFTQLIDLITYFYYKIYINDTNMDNFKAIKKSYLKHIKDIVIEKDLTEYLKKSS